MLATLRTRTAAAIALATCGAIAILLLGSSAQAALVAWVGGLAAVVLASGIGEADKDASALLPGPADSQRGAPLSDILDAVAAPLLLVSNGRVTTANRAARRLLGEHIAGEDVRVAIRHPAAAERLAEGAGDASEPIELVGLGTIDQHWEMRVDHVPSGEQVVYLVDRTGSHAAERMRVDFVANASHELRTPLASILGYVETLRDAAGDDPDIRERFLKIVDDEARRMQRLVDDLISLSRIEADKYRLPDGAVDLAALCDDVRAEMADVHDGRGGDIALDVETEAAIVTGDRAQLSQMLHNLIGNAMKYGRAGTPVTVRLDLDRGDMLRLAIVDEGDGIAPRHLPRLTERFYRADAGRSRSLGGTGLGLAIVKHIVERHRGRLHIASTVGRGTTVTVLLPAAVSSNGNASVTQPLLSSE